MQNVTAKTISEFLDENPGASLSLRKQRLNFSVRIVSPANTPERTVVIANEDIDVAILNAIDSYRTGDGQ